MNEIVNSEMQKHIVKEYSEEIINMQGIQNMTSKQRMNASLRNNSQVVKKTTGNDTFDIIKHGPSLKEKTNDSSFVSSPLRGSDPPYQFSKPAQAMLNLQPCQ